MITSIKDLISGAVGTTGQLMDSNHDGIGGAIGTTCEANGATDMVAAAAGLDGGGVLAAEEVLGVMC